MEFNPSKNYEEYRSAAYWLYKELLQPIMVHNQGIEQLTIIADGELGNLPFEAFLVQEAPQTQTNYATLHYLVKDYAINYNYAAVLWKENLETPATPTPKQFLGIAADYASKSTLERLPRLQNLRSTLQPLPAAQEEVKNIANIFSGDFLFGTDANEAFFKKNAANYQVIHLAMHGILNADEPLLSSLVFTENNDSLEDNFLQAFEISHEHINADLVVLSACETGYGRFEQGNGIASLARSFMYAGVPSLVVSLWQVNEASTAIIMGNFYKNLAAGQAKNHALRQAKVDYLQLADGLAAHPAFWSPFVQIGNHQPLNIQRSNNWLSWTLGGLAALAVLGGAFAWQKRKLK